VHRASDPGTVPYNAEEKMAPSVHHRHASYPGSQSQSRRASELVHDRRDDRGREDKRHRSPSRSRSSRQSSRHNSLVPSENKEDAHPSHYRQHSLREAEHHRSQGRDSRRRSSSRSSHSGIVSSSMSCLASAITSVGSESRRNKYPPSPLSTVHPSLSRSTNSPAARDGSRPPTATNTSVRRAPSPKNHSFRASLPEIHYTDRRRQSTARENALARDALEHSAEINRRASYYGPPPAAVEDEGRRAKAREYGHPMERRASSGEEQNYRLYGSPVSRETVAKAQTPAQAPAHTKTEVSVVPAVAYSSSSSSSLSPRVFPARPPVSLAATVTSLEDELAGHREDDGSDSDQTWEDYLWTNPQVAPVA
jgi:hypothetical protein